VLRSLRENSSEGECFDLQIGKNLRKISEFPQDFMRTLWYSFQLLCKDGGLMKKLHECSSGKHYWQKGTVVRPLSTASRSFCCIRAVRETAYGRVSKGGRM